MMFSESRDGFHHCVNTNPFTISNPFNIDYYEGQPEPVVDAVRAVAQAVHDVDLVPVFLWGTTLDAWLKCDITSADGPVELFIPADGFVSEEHFVLFHVCIQLN